MCDGIYMHLQNINSMRDEKYGTSTNPTTFNWDITHSNFILELLDLKQISSAHKKQSRTESHSRLSPTVSRKSTGTQNDTFSRNMKPHSSSPF